MKSASKDGAPLPFGLINRIENYTGLHFCSILEFYLNRTLVSYGFSEAIREKLENLLSCDTSTFSITCYGIFWILTHLII
jgi:hypothetical protein